MTYFHRFCYRFVVKIYIYSSTRELGQNFLYCLLLLSAIKKNFYSYCFDSFWEKLSLNRKNNNAGLQKKIKEEARGGGGFQRGENINPSPPPPASNLVGEDIYNFSARREVRLHMNSIQDICSFYIPVHSAKQNSLPEVIHIFCRNCPV